MGELIFFGVVALLTLMGSAFLAIAVALGKKQKNKVKNCTHKTTARVIGMQRMTNRNSYATPTISWYPVYEYYAGPQRLEKQSTFGQDNQIFYEGQIVELFYNPNDWNEYYVPAERTGKLNTILGIVGCILLACTVLAVIGYTLIF